MNFLYTKNALKQLQKLPKSVRKRIVEKMQWYRVQEDPLHYAKKLEQEKNTMYRFRIGEYRVITEKDDQGKICILLVLEIKHRKDVYKK